MVRQYPHYLFKLNDRGEKVYLCRCREESNTNKALRQADGLQLINTAVIYCKPCVLALYEGETLAVSNDAVGRDERVRGQVLKFDRGQLHNRIWI